LTAPKKSAKIAALRLSQEDSMIAPVFSLLLALAPHACAAPASASPADQRSSTDKKSKDLIADFGSTADLPPNLWSCRASKKAVAAAKGATLADPLADASDLKCLTEWLWSVQRYFAGGGKVKPGLEPDFVAGEKKRAAALADGLSRWAAALDAAPKN
jgi:hypothetical protein